jgi:HEAT repeat protein
MPIALDQVRRLLDPDEPDYAAAARLGPELLPHLKALVDSGNVHYGSKAAFLASLIDHDQAVEILRRAAKSPSPLVRAAAAGGTRSMTRPTAAGVLLALLEDRDAGVRKLAIESSAIRNNPALLAKIGHLSQNDPAPTIRLLAARALSDARTRRLG